MSHSDTAALRAGTIESSSLYNKDLAPVDSARRRWRTYNYAALWISMIVSLAPGWARFHSGAAVCFVLFWLLNVFVILRGIETIRLLQGISAPFLLLIGLALLLWARGKAGGFGPMLSTPSKFQSFSEFFRFFVPSLTGVVGFWATVSLNIPDFTRYARSQRDQMIGQA